MCQDNPSPRTPYGEQLEELKRREKYAATNLKAAEQQMYQNATASGLIGSNRLTLRDRLKRTMESAQQEERRSRKSSELYDLLNKHPEVARILELIEELQ